MMRDGDDVQIGSEIPSCGREFHEDRPIFESRLWTSELTLAAVGKTDFQRSGVRNSDSAEGIGSLAEAFVLADVDSRSGANIGKSFGFPHSARRLSMLIGKLDL